MLRPAAALLTLLTVALGGCVTQSLEPNLALPLLAEPWRENWTTTGSDFAFDLDPSARMLHGEGTITLRNDLGHALPHVLVYLAPYDLLWVRDAQGNDLAFDLEREALPTQVLPEELLDEGGGIRVWNVTLPGDVGPGAAQTLRMAYEGWGSSDDVVLGGGAPSDLAMPFLPLHPRTNVVSNTGAGQFPSTFTLAHPEDWVVLATAEPLASTVEGGVVTTRYTSHVVAASAVMAQGLEWLEEDVRGIHVKTFFFPDMRIQGQTVHDITRHVLTVMPNLTGPYPFQHLWTVPNQVVANAFSTPGLTFMGLNFYRFHVPGAPLQFSRAFFPAVIPGGQDSYEQVVVHEHVHNWWGHNVRGNNTNATLGPLEQWVTEGVTTYLSELVWMQTQYGEEDAAHTARDRGFDVLRRRQANGDERAITEPGGAPYSKTAMALRALEAYAIQQGKPTAVLDALTLAQERFGRLQGGPGMATTEQMFQVFEETFGEPLRWHLDPWFLGREQSDFRIAGVERGEGNLTVRVANAGEVPAAVQLKATSASGRVLWAWGFVPGGDEAAVAVPLPAGFAEPIVRIEADPYQYVYEWDDTDNVWVGNA
jgi:hypothetical protein